MKVVYQSFEGRYSDNPRALFEAWQRERPGDEHVWFADPAHLHGFPAGTTTVPPTGPEAVAALESADLLVANTHTDMEWQKRPGAVYLQTWHGTPLKRIHHDVLWAPEGRLARLDLDVARWDLLISPNAESTPRMQRAFGFTGEVLETGYPRNDLLSSPDRDAVRARVRRELGIEDGTTAVLYAPTWRDDAYFAEGRPDMVLGLDLPGLTSALGGNHVVMLRLHYLASDRLPPQEGPAVRDVSQHPDIAELYLAADVLVTDYSSTMFDFAVTGKPLVFYTYDHARFRDEVRGFYFDLEDDAPGPVLADQGALADVLLDLPALQQSHGDAYARFAERWCHLEDGAATSRVLEWLWAS
ncbi:CDP-glycerol glycerophosphotransferase family protein [Modestobacter sp. I12A-02628]|uniref:CDP-glycerol glycerophosphotransferase family protein n=1 Tax=Goekera deserti TaxID=2497753 RepID=A0A7K3WAW1_9ACTN|nr:CDP-glycerol glycerophosphotransferase family protein [Goekera deserti]MPQ97552.1 CDP-glycerol glycerophosphotransferase family protein [Goekera deserti]NDI47844.1 CDP-glycerol glycerophosphotransferase family protein [Goekera deserti]NEL53592.1 CDP-glycerol glycerophosphotransferase family protein [Goekera deserti]